MTIHFEFNKSKILTITIYTNNQIMFTQTLNIENILNLTCPTYEIQVEQYIGLFQKLNTHNILTYSMFKQAMYKYILFYQKNKELLEEPAINNIFIYTHHLS